MAFDPANAALNGLEVTDGDVYSPPRVVEHRSRKWSSWNTAEKRHHSAISLALAAVVGMVVYGVLAEDLAGLRQQTEALGRRDGVLAEDLVGLRHETEALRRRATLASAAEAEIVQAVRQQREQAKNLSSELASVHQTVGELRRKATEILDRQVALATATQAAQQQREQAEGLARDLTALRQEVEILKSSRETAHETSSQPSLVNAAVPLPSPPLGSERADTAAAIGAQPASAAVGTPFRAVQSATELSKTGSITAATAHQVTEADQRREIVKLPRADAAQPKAQESRQSKQVDHKKTAARRGAAVICNGCSGRSGRAGGKQAIPPTIEGPDGMPARLEDFRSEWSY
jgi:hypothetical protein